VSGSELEQLKGENRHAPTHIFSVQQAAPFSHDQGCANGPFHDAAKNYVAEHNTLRKAHLHNDMKGYGSETDAISPFSGKPLDTKIVTCCTEKLQRAGKRLKKHSGMLAKL